jgi:hypothetical protein
VCVTESLKNEGLIIGGKLPQRIPSKMCSQKVNPGTPATKAAQCRGIQVVGFSWVNYDLLRQVQSLLAVRLWEVSAQYSILPWPANRPSRSIGSRRTALATPVTVRRAGGFVLTAHPETIHLVL